MSERKDCDTLAELAPELALGTLAGDRRAWALEHLAGCADCRRRVEELSAVADALLLLAPAREPPAGFESRVLERLPSRARRPRWRRLALLAASLLLSAAVGAAGVYVAGAGDRGLAGRYQRTLAASGGGSFGAWRLGNAGSVFVYQGSPSWMFVSMQPSAGAGPFACELLLRDGRRVPLGTFSLRAYQTGWGRTVPVSLHDVASVQLRDLGRNRVFEARLA
jgi:hypothetical protein